MLNLEKEILTPEYIRKLVRKDSLAVVIMIPVLIALPVSYLAFFLVGCFAVKAYARGVILGILLAVYLFGVIRIFLKHFKRLQKLPKEPLVVISKRIMPPKNKPETFVSNRREGYVLYFEHYGKYSIVDFAYPDRLCDGLDAGGLFNSSLYGEEFYLVLDQDLKIVLAYQCSCFEYTGVITQHSIVNGRVQRT